MFRRESEVLESEDMHERDAKREKVEREGNVKRNSFIVKS